MDPVSGYRPKRGKKGRKIIVVSDSETDKTIEICKKHDLKAMKIGKVVRERDVKIETPSGIISVI